MKNIFSLVKNTYIWKLQSTVMLPLKTIDAFSHQNIDIWVVIPYTILVSIIFVSYITLPSRPPNIYIWVIIPKYFFSSYVSLPCRPPCYNSAKCMNVRLRMWFKWKVERLNVLCDVDCAQCQSQKNKSVFIWCINRCYCCCPNY